MFSPNSSVNACFNTGSNANLGSVDSVVLLSRGAAGVCRGGGSMIGVVFGTGGVVDSVVEGDGDETLSGGIMTPGPLSF